MPSFFISWSHRWRELLKERKFRISFVAGLALLLIAGFIDYEAAFYTEKIPVAAVGDVILDIIPTVNLSFLYTFGIFVTAFVIALYPILFKPELAPFTAKTVAAFILLRAFFITLTHLGVPEGYFRFPEFESEPPYLRFFYTNDLFFSGHTGFPYLGALLFWENKLLRFLLLGMSGAQAITVLFMHLHYSIDVFSAYFITYTIYVVSDKIFNELNLSFRRIVERIEIKMGIMKK